MPAPWAVDAGARRALRPARPCSRPVRARAVDAPPWARVTDLPGAHIGLVVGAQGSIPRSVRRPAASEGGAWLNPANG